MAKAKESLTSTISGAIKGTADLEKFKKGKNLSAGVVFKEQSWIPLSQAKMSKKKMGKKK